MVEVRSGSVELSLEIGETISRDNPPTPNVFPRTEILAAPLIIPTLEKFSFTWQIDLPKINSNWRETKLLYQILHLRID